MTDQPGPNPAEISPGAGGSKDDAPATKRPAQWPLVGIVAMYLVFLGLAIGVIVRLAAVGIIEMVEANLLIKKVLAAYAPACGALIGSLIAGTASATKISVTSVVASLVLCFLWNVALVGRYLLLLFNPGADNMSLVLEFQDTWLAGANFLVTAAIAFFAGKSTTET